MPERKRVRFSVIVPVFQQWHLVPDLVAAIERQTVGAEAVELILVDNGTPGFQRPKNLPENVLTLICAEPGSYAARDHGAQEASGDLLAFTDADCRPTPAWLEAFDRAAKNGGKIFGGAIDTLASASPNAFEVHSLVRGIPQEFYVQRGYAATANFCVHADLYRQLGGFNRKLLSGGDAEFCRRACVSGHPVSLVADARVNHLARNTGRQIAIKARRIAGALVTSGNLGSRFSGVIRIIAPPFVAWRQELSAADHPLRRRLIAMGVETVVWAVQIGETFRLACGFPPERR